MTNDEFQDLFNTHWLWQEGVFYKEVLHEKYLDFYFAFFKSEYFNLVLPDTNDTALINLDKVREEFEKRDLVPSFYLTQNNKEAFNKFLSKNSYKPLDSDCWMVKDTSKEINKINSEVIQITPDTFSDFYSVLSVVFADFPANEEYLKICKNSLSGNLKSKYKDLKSELFVIYDNGKPASGGGMFYSIEGNFAYLHDAGTLEEFRGRGYQTDLINFRTQKAQSLGISRIYSLVEHGEQSYKNMIKNGFEEKDQAQIMVLKQ